jgi:DNA modification methylase
MVGDSTSPESYRCLLAEDPESKANMLWTDPPYNVDYSGAAGKIKNDKMSDEQFAEFLGRFYSTVIDFLQPGSPAYIAHADGRPSIPFRAEFVRAGFYYSAVLIWRKSQSTIGRADYHFQHEPLLYGWAPGAAHHWYGGRKRKSIIEFGTPPLFTLAADGEGYHLNIGNEVLVVKGENLTVESLAPTIIEFNKPLSSKLHPTMKPVALVEHCLLNSSKKGDVVLDCFGGSGTTLIACELRGRKARLVELDPKFADVIIQRWQDFTGRVAFFSNGATYSEIVEERGLNARADKEAA